MIGGFQINSTFYTWQKPLGEEKKPRIQKEAQEDASHTTRTIKYNSYRVRERGEAAYKDNPRRSRSVDSIRKVRGTSSLGRYVRLLADQRLGEDAKWMKSK
jgi:hypothetical protein